jgi:metal-responsive CopG/Arc/MetJ family transcriptional regulator
MMKTIQMTIDESLLNQVDRATAELQTTRSAFIRQALKDALQGLGTQRLERQHKRGYARRPVKSGEFDAWQDEQVWESK